MTVGAMNEISVPVINAIDWLMKIASSMERTRIVGIEIDLNIIAIRMKMERIESALVFFAATFGVYLTCDINIVKELCSLLARGSLISAAIIILLLPPIMSLLEGVINKTTYNFRGTKIPKKKKNIKTGEAAQ